MGHVQSIVYQQEKSVHEPPYRYNRTPLETATLVAGYGIEGDRKAGGNPNRNLNVMSAEVLTGGLIHVGDPVTVLDG